MQEEEASAFAQSLAIDSQLREKTEAIKLLLLGIKESVLEERMKNFHKEITPVIDSKKNTRVIPLARKLLVAASILTIIGLSLWWLLQNGNSKEKVYSKYYSPDPGLATVMSR